METEKVNYKKVTLKTAGMICLLILVVLIMNTWPLIKSSFAGQVPAFDYWLDHSFRPSNIILIIGFSAYFFYRNLSREKQAIQWREDYRKNNGDLEP